jgi:hypothetical protein
MSSEFSSIRTKDKLEIAVSTDTVLYLPFYIAYYSNDFRDTPFTDLEVVIIGTQNDLRFKKGLKLKGDGYATFAVLLGLADAAICDPSFFIYLSNCEDGALEIQLNKFQNLLELDTKKDICRGFDNPEDVVLSECFEVNSGNELVFKDVSSFKEKILIKHTKIIGGLVSKIAFLVVGSENLKQKENENIEKSLGRLYLPKNVPSSFGISNITNSFFYYNSPSTGNCIGNIYSEKYKKQREKDGAKGGTLLINTVDFGYELRNLSMKTFKNKEDIWEEIENDSFCTNSASFSCDFISIDFLLDKHNREVNKRIIEIENLAYDSNKNYMFTGILGNNRPENSDKLKGLLYGIDKALYKIQSYLRKSDTTGLIQYLKLKLKYDDDTQDMLLDLLIADDNIKNYIKYQINHKALAYSFENVLKYYVDRLREWKQVGNLYYSNTKPIEADLKELTLLRNKTDDGIIYKNFVADDLLSEFRINESKYYLLEKKSLHNKSTKFLILLSPLLIILSLWRPLKKYIFHKLSPKILKNDYIEKLFVPIEAALWRFVRKPVFLYLFGSLFILLEIISSLFHLFDIPKFNFSHLNFNYPVTKLVPGSEEFYYTVLNIIPVGEIIFALFVLYFLTIFLSFRNLLKLKKEGQYFYRNE